ncbi:DUF3659 domain-containing protein [Escherichia coli]
MNQQDQRLTNLYKLVTDYTSVEHEKLLPSPESNSLQWFKSFKYLNPVSWAAGPQKIPYIAATTLIDAYSCLPRRPDMAFTYLWTAINNSYNDLFLRHNTTSGSLGDSKAIDNSIELISEVINSRINNKKTISEEYKSKTINEIVIEFAKRLPDKNLNFLSSYLLKGMAIKNHNAHQIQPPIRSIHISSSYRTFAKRFELIHNHLYWNFSKKYSSICSIKESTDKTSLNFGITKVFWDADKCIGITGKNGNITDENGNVIGVDNKIISRRITQAMSRELQRIIVDNPKLDLFDKNGNSVGKAFAFSSDIQRLEFLIFNLLYASRNNNIHGNVASRINSIFANKDTITAATWNFLFGYFYLSLLLLCLNSINVDDLDVHLFNVELLQITKKTV